MMKVKKIWLQLRSYYGEYLLLIALAVIIGLIVGVIDAYFGMGLLAITDIRDDHPYYFIPFLAIIGVFIIFMYQKYGKNSQQGMGLIFDVGQKKASDIPLRLVPFIIGGTWLTHLFGGSAGREGVAVQIGATVSHTVGQKLNLKKHQTTLIVIGMAAGFAGLFQTPIAATFFALEVMFVGQLVYPALIPALIAAFIASGTSHFLGLEKFQVFVSDAFAFHFANFAKLMIIGIIFGLTGSLFAKGLAYLKTFMAEKMVNPYLRIFIVGIVLSILLLLCHGGRYAGLGTNLIAASFSGQTIYLYDFIAKLLFTIVTLSVGFQGGEVTPLFSIGASLGIVLAGLFHMPVILVAALGYAAVFGSATNTLLAPILIGCEVFGFNYFPYFFIVCAFAYFFNFDQSIYGKQLKKIQM
ncbi:chloride channel protein [Enterococcus cecorum]|uniref:Chloride channel protein n=1 Tax=Enterococcus cecorum TaxID=44008 RepID=A0AAW9JRC2_9ENTE|nr:chloride channel protein [Enterococcus cecorum]MDZ5503566.1 chloride channel protein [Enterococcus cecorum]MDZ5530997.1 chloride channel protein [Enterococcus cecorum]MDZ5544335.1 chloride channel protein [Enterococcus cecorum]MDZ5548761.1 chloride channel protein [Enterococcus cecorum]MDZ5551733.1 chloride channel protein [Enterococcus cecorum]